MNRRWRHRKGDSPKIFPVLADIVKILGAITTVIIVWLRHCN
jgi:hypothetical protein